MKSRAKQVSKPNAPDTAKLVIISGPGGVGKTTIIRKLFCDKEIASTCIRGITVTTRQRRNEECDGKDYFFVSKDEFAWLKEAKFFLESQQVVDNYYGTPKLFYTLAQQKRKHLIVCIDVKGGMYLKRNLKAATIVTIFIAAPNVDELCHRMKKRLEAKSVIQSRVALAKEEIKFSRHYDHVVTNADIRATVKQLRDIILKQS